MPKANEKDLRDVPQEVREHMVFTFVERMDEVLHLALLPKAATEIADVLPIPEIPAVAPVDRPLATP